ncbi:MAG: hypothetical protein Q8O57_13870, partial [Kiritimatiellota bacterium]|nr:hypothetical protein [Kiritimatiellota bacterium]
MVFGNSVAGQAANAVAPALAFYVDAVKGDDANDGLSEKAPLKTLNAAQRLMDVVPEGGKVTLNLARGSVWREDREDKDFLARGRKRAEINFGRASLTIRAYGQGDKPTISG